MYCTKCGTQISDTSTFCSSCGSKIEILSDSKNNNEESFVDSDNNCRDDSSGRFGHSLHHLSWRCHTYHGVARWATTTNKRKGSDGPSSLIVCSYQSNGVPITSCGLSHTSLFKTGLNETSTILEQSDDANGLFTHFSSRAFSHKANNRDNDTIRPGTEKASSPTFQHKICWHHTGAIRYFGQAHTPIFQRYARNTQECTARLSRTTKGRKVLSHTPQHLIPHGE